jgi:hypothetical protein
MVNEQESEAGGGKFAKTQYDKIGTKYNQIKTLTGVEPEEPSAVKALGDVRGKRCLGTFIKLSNSQQPNQHKITRSRSPY